MDVSQLDQLIGGRPEQVFLASRRYLQVVGPRFGRPDQLPIHALCRGCPFDRPGFRCKDHDE
jgi:hypothetical protein